MTESAKPELIRLEDALMGGSTQRALAHLVDTNDLIRLRPGAFVRAEDFEAAYREVRHLLVVRASLDLCAAGSVLSHVSAGVLHGLPVWGIDTNRVHITKQRAAGGHLSDGLHTHVQPMDPDETVEVNGLPTTSVARTVVDLARVSPFEQGVVVADAALSRGLTTREELDEAASRARRRQGAEMARRVVNFADVGGQSVGESRSRVLMRRAGMQIPELQLQVCTAAGTLIARSDFGVRELKWVGEFDGLVKYGRLRMEGETEGDAVAREKVREDLVRDEGWLMLRWIWRELSFPVQLLARFRRSFASASNRL